MKLEVDTSAPSVAKVSLNVPAEEFEKEVRGGLASVSGNVRMKGFRPGKVPLKYLEKQFGEGVRSQVKENFVQKAYGRAVEENKLKPLSHPRISEEDLELEEDGSFAVDFEVPLRPVVDLPDYRGLKATSELEPVMDEQIDTTIDELRKSQSTPEPAGEDGVDEDGFVLANVLFLHDELLVWEREGIRLNTVSVPPGVDEEQFAKDLLGAKDGDVLEFPITLPEFIEDEELRGEEGTCRVEVNQAMRLVPPSDEDLIGVLGDEVTDMDSMRAFVRAKLEENARERENHRLETLLLDRVLESVDVELPETMIEQQTEARLAQLAGQMEGASEEEIEAAKEAQRDATRAEALKGMKALFVVETIGEKEELLVTREDIDEQFASIAERNQSDVNEVREYYSENNLGQQLAIEILEKKVRRFLRENADVSDPA